MKILFWSKDLDPNDHINQIGPSSTAATAIIEILKMGTVKARYKGPANCRIIGCKKSLGTQDLEGYGFVWPQKAEHYIEAHGLWVDGLDDLLDAVYEPKSKNIPQ